MDALARSDLDLERALTPAQKLAQALEMMELGLRLKRQALRRDNPQATEQEIERLYLAWLLADE